MNVAAVMSAFLSEHPEDLHIVIHSVQYLFVRRLVGLDSV